MNRANYDSMSGRVGALANATSPRVSGALNHENRTSCQNDNNTRPLRRPTLRLVRFSHNNAPESVICASVVSARFEIHERYEQGGFVLDRKNRSRGVRQPKDRNGGETKKKRSSSIKKKKRKFGTQKKRRIESNGSNGRWKKGARS